MKLTISLVALIMASSASAQAPTFRQSAVSVTRLEQPSSAPATLDRRFRHSFATERCKTLGTYAGVGMVVGLVGGAAYGISHTRHQPFGFYTVWLDAMGGMLAGALVGAAVFWVREGK